MWNGANRPDSPDELKRPPAGAAAQRERVLAEMRRRRGTAQPWVSGEDFRADPTCDGHPPIVNVTPRVSELRRLHEIVTERGPDGCARYRLAFDCGDSTPPLGEIVAEAARGDRDDAAREQLALELPIGSPPARSAIYDDWDAA